MWTPRFGLFEPVSDVSPSQFSACAVAQVRSEAPARLALEPTTAAVVDKAAKQPLTRGLTLQQLRSGNRVTVVIENSVAPDAGIEARDDAAAGPAVSTSVRVYTPASVVSPKTMALPSYVHSGGFAVGDLEFHDSLLRLIANGLGHPRARAGSPASRRLTGKPSWTPRATSPPRSSLHVSPRAMHRSEEAANADLKE
jgi:hypothetical protein